MFKWLTTPTSNELASKKVPSLSSAPTGTDRLNCCVIEPFFCLIRRAFFSFGSEDGKFNAMVVQVIKDTKHFVKNYYSMASETAEETAAQENAITEPSTRVKLLCHVALPKPQEPKVKAAGGALHVGPSTWRINHFQQLGNAIHNFNSCRCNRALSS